MAGSIDMVKSGRRRRAARSADLRTDPPTQTSASIGDAGVGVTLMVRPRHSNSSPVKAWRRTSRYSSVSRPRVARSTSAMANSSWR